MDDIPTPIARRSRRFLDQVRRCMRDRKLGYSTEKTYLHWIRAFIRFHKMGHPTQMGAAEVDAFLSWLSIERRGKGGKDRRTVLPDSLRGALAAQINAVEKLHAYDTANGYGEVYMPDTLARKYPNGAHELAWQFVFPAGSTAADPLTGVIRRHHVHPGTVRKNVTRALRASGINKRATCHTFRHSFATRADSRPGEWFRSRLRSCDRSWQRCRASGGRSKPGKA